jgi:BNR repeat-like domain
MIKLIVSMFLSLMVTTTIAGEPFSIYDGSNAVPPKQPQACLTPDGIAHLTFGVGDKVFYCQLNRQNAAVPRVAFQVPNMSLGMRRGPRIAHAGKSIVITTIGGAQGKGRDGDLLSYRSSDDGQSWVGPVRVNDVESSAREGLHAMTASKDGVLWCVWLDLREKGTQLFASQSIDQGQSWSKNIRVYRSPDGSVCECCHPSIATEGNSVHVLFRNSLKGNRDMYLVSSNDRGATFGPGDRLGIQHWNLNACPMDGGMLAITPDGDVVSAWRRGGQVYTTSGKEPLETMMENGEQPWIASNSGGTYVAWLTKRDGELRMKKLGTANPVKIAESAGDPVVIAGHGNQSLIYLFWEQRVGERTFIKCQITP